MKIAVPVEGANLRIATRTGQAPFFALFHGGTFERIVEAPQGGHHEDHDHHEHGDHQAHINGHGKSLVNIAGYELMLVRAIGTHMKAALEEAGIAIKKIRRHDGEFAGEAVKNYLQGAEA